MQAIILAAGRGSRLGEAAAGLPKCLLPIGGRTILERQVEALAAVGVEGPVVVTGFGAEAVRRALAGRATFVHNPDYATTNVLASWSIGSAALAADHFYLHGDTVFETEILRRALAGPTAAGIVLTVDRRPCGGEEMKVRIETAERPNRRAVGGRVIAIDKEMPPSQALGEFTGVMLVRAHLLPDLRRIASRLLASPGGGRLFFEAAVQQVLDRGGDDVAWVDVSGLRWCEIDFPGDLETARSLFARPDRD